MAYPPVMVKVFAGLRFSTLFYLPTVFDIPPAVLRPKVPATIFNSVGDYNFLRNAAFAFTPLIVLLFITIVMKLLTVP